MTGSVDPYIVEIKRSARRINAAASEWVARRGRTRTFATKADARRWAATISGGGPVRIQDAAPNDPEAVDGYLVADPYYTRRKKDSPAGAEAGTLGSLGSTGQ